MGWILLIVFIIVVIAMYIDIFLSNKKLSEYKEDITLLKESKKWIRRLYMYITIEIIIVVLAIIVKLVG